MFFKISDTLRALSKSSFIFKSLFEDIKIQIKLLTLFYREFIFTRNLKRNLNCSINTIKGYYRHLGYYHLEICAHNGFFINTAKVHDIFPEITVVDTDTASYQNLELRLETSFCKTFLLNTDIKSSGLQLPKATYNSVGLQLVLETLPGGLNQIENLLIKIKESLNPYNGVVFGSTVVAKGLHHKKNAAAFINKQNENKLWFNKDLDLENLYIIFTRHFTNVSLHYEGSVVFFILEPEQKKLKLKPKLPLDHPLDIPFV